VVKQAARVPLHSKAPCGRLNPASPRSLKRIAGPNQSGAPPPFQSPLSDSINEKYGQYPQQAHFPTLLGQAFTALGLSTPQTSPQPGEPPQRRIERALYEAGCAVNALRNKSGTGQGRPFLPKLSDDEARAAVQLIGIISGLLLRTLKKNP